MKLFSDIAALSVEQCESRYKEMMERTKQERHQHELFTAEFITADCTKVRLVLFIIYIYMCICGMYMYIYTYADI